MYSWMLFKNNISHSCTFSYCEGVSVEILSRSYTFCFRVRTHVRIPYPCPSIWITPYSNFLSDIWWFWPYLVTFLQNRWKITSIWRLFNQCLLWKGSYTFPSVCGNGLTDAKIRTRAGVAEAWATPYISVSVPVSDFRTGVRCFKLHPF